MTKARIGLVVALTLAGAAGLWAGLWRLYVAWAAADFIVTNHTGVDVLDVEVIRYGKTQGRIERLAPNATERLPVTGWEDGWEVAYTDAEGRWLCRGCVYPVECNDEPVVLRPKHRVNSDQAIRVQ